MSTEGIIPALESSHAVAHAMKIAPTMAKDKVLLVNMSGRGDKDMATVAERSGLQFYCRPSCQANQASQATPTTQAIQVQQAKP